MALFQAIVKTLVGRKPGTNAADTMEQESSWDPSKRWYSSEEEELEERAQEQVWESLEVQQESVRENVACCFRVDSD